MIRARDLKIHCEYLAAARQPVIGHPEIPRRRDFPLSSRARESFRRSLRNSIFPFVRSLLR